MYSEFTFTEGSIKITIRVYGGGIGVMHYQIRINDKFIGDSGGYDIVAGMTEMFPDNEELIAWAYQMRNDDKTAYRQGVKLP